ncbi:MAG: MBL fold metallo-hydrolase [Patescibacteria group bacterium]
MKIKFHGVRGSVPAGLVGSEVEEKILINITNYRKFYSNAPNSAARVLSVENFLKERPFWEKNTYGGDTSCVELVCGNERFVLDMGTGLRRLGNSLFKEMFSKSGLMISFCLSHVHWDHIQGLPFFGPLYINQNIGIKNQWKFLGGTNWHKTAEACLRGQMDPPTFPISWKEIEKITYHPIEMQDIFDGYTFTKTKNGIVVKVRKLHHPQETYGWRFEYNGKIFAYTTDNEPFNPEFPDPNLLELWKDADVVVTDCQYTQHTYEGLDGGPNRHDWGHSYPEAVAKTAIMAKAKKVVLFHHDPSSTDKKIFEIERYTENFISQMGASIPVVAAYQGLEIDLN